MPRSRTFNRKDVDRVREILSQAPEKPKEQAPLTTREMVASMTNEIQDLQKRGYSLEEISEMIRQGFNLENLGAATLKQYLKKKETKVKKITRPISSRKPKESNDAASKSVESLREEDR